MSEINITQEIKSVTLEAVVIRKDGTREDLGVISSWSAEDEPDKEDE